MKRDPDVDVFWGVVLLTCALLMLFAIGAVK